MERYKFPLFPGPTTVPKTHIEPYGVDYASSDVEDDFFELYRTTQRKVQKLLNANGSSVVLMSGEAMVALWGALKSVISKGDKVLAIGTGVFGDGIGEMAEMIGANVRIEKWPWNQVALDVERIRKVAHEFKPKLITLVHCETPSGTLNIKIKEIGAIAREVDALFYVDFVSSGGGTLVDVDNWNIDLGLLGTQKCLNLPPDLGIVTVSPRAWEAVQQVKYVGYDALLPWKGAEEKEVQYFPYTHNWRAVAALNVSVESILNEGLENVFARHQRAKDYTLKRIKDIGLKLWPESEEISSPTVTAVEVPSHLTWNQLDKALRAQGVSFGGSYGHLAGKVFRIGHMGVQADLDLLQKALDILEKTVKSL